MFKKLQGFFLPCTLFHSRNWKTKSVFHCAAFPSLVWACSLVRRFDHRIMREKLTLTPKFQFLRHLKNLTFDILSLFLGYNDCSRGASNANWNHKMATGVEAYRVASYNDTHIARHGWHRLDELQILQNIPDVARLKNHCNFFFVSARAKVQSTK